MTELRYQRLSHADGLPGLEKYSVAASGFDLRSATETDVVLEPGARLVVPTGLALEIPLGFEGQVRPRSGLAAQAGVTVLNSPGTVDSDYRGELKVILINLGDKAVTISRGDRIAQLVLAPVAAGLAATEVEELSPTDRGSGGFGSTGGAPDPG